MELIDLKAQQPPIRDKVDAAIKRVLDQGADIMGTEVTRLEKELPQFAGAKHCISSGSGSGSGTDALVIALMAMGSAGATP